MIAFGVLLLLSIVAMSVLSSVVKHRRDPDAWTLFDFLFRD